MTDPQMIGKYERTTEIRATMSISQRRRYEYTWPRELLPLPQKGRTFIYGLMDPNRKIHYIGMTPDLLHRVRMHYGSRNAQHRWQRNPRLQVWLQSLERCPEACVLEEVDVLEGFKIETYWIQFFRRLLGDELLNKFETPWGNETHVGRHHTEETKAKMREAWCKRRENHND